MDKNITLIFKTDVLDMFKCAVYTQEGRGMKYKFIIHFINQRAFGTGCVLNSTNYYTLEDCLEDAYKVMHVSAYPVDKSFRHAIKKDLSTRKIIQWNIYEINVKYIHALQRREDLLRGASLPLPCHSRGDNIGRKIRKFQTKQSELPKFNRDDYRDAYGYWENLTFSFA